MSVLKFKKRADLLEYAGKNPGALSAQFLLAVFERLNSTAATNEKQLYGMDVHKWARDHSGLKELRDLRECQTLALIIQKLGRDQLPQAMDVACQRIKSVTLAKSPKGSWEQSAKVELLPMTETAIALPSEISLAGLPS